MARGKTRRGVVGQLVPLAVPRLKEGRWADGAGLYLNVTSGGARSWLFRYTLAGKVREIGLGSFTAVGVAEARESASRARQLIHAGQDPKAAGAVAAAPMTFREATAAFHTAHRAGWRSPRHAANWLSSVETWVYPRIGNLSVAEVDRPAVLAVLSPLWTVKPETAKRLRGRIESVLGWATQHGHRTGENPAMWKGALEHALPRLGRARPVEHLAALPYVELPGLLASLRRQPGSAASALAFCILTAARTEEARCARWGEFDLAGRLWTIPAERMKAGREHRVPLSAEAVAAIPTATGEFLFPGPRGRGKPINRDALADELAKLRPARACTVHGMRSTFRDWCAETGVRRELAEAALAHNDKTSTEAAYNRTALVEQRRPVMEAWAQFCEGGEPAAALRGAIG